MQPLRNIIGTCIKGFNIEDGAVLNSVRKEWTDIVGKTVAVHTWPDMVKAKVLTIIVDTPQWIHHLGFFKEDISGKLRSYNIADIRFRLGRLPEKGEGSPVVEENVELTDEDARFIENTVRNVKDGELKEKLKTLITHGLTKGRAGKSGSEKS